MTKAAAQFAPKWVSPPGETILDLLEERGWPQTEFAERAGYTSKHVSLLINGKAPNNGRYCLSARKSAGRDGRFLALKRSEVS